MKPKNANEKKWFAQNHLNSNRLKDRIIFYYLSAPAVGHAYACAYLSKTTDSNRIWTDEPAQIFNIDFYLLGSPSLSVPLSLSF